MPPQHLPNQADCTGLPVPQRNERPTTFADRVGEWYVAQRSERHRKEHGLFLTPVDAAKFMSSWVDAKGQSLRVLDPAAGAGVLCCAAVERLVDNDPKPVRIQLVAYEVDQDLIPLLTRVLDHLDKWCRAQQVVLAVRIEAADFVVANAGVLQAAVDLVPSITEGGRFDVVISNPPYFKIGKDDPRSMAASCVVDGQPNIYALFMAVGAGLLRQHGDFIYITLRSFASGRYFRRFRNAFFGMIKPTSVHVFESRRDAFSRDEVLQENVILHGIRQDGWHKRECNESVAISSSFGIRDMSSARSRDIATTTALDCSSAEKVLRLPTSADADAAIALVDSWTNSLQGLGVCISTGPVVPFRASQLIDRVGDVPTSHVPLLWMNHVQAMRTTWPLDNHKPEYIARSGAGPLVVANKNYVLIRRFSAKEQTRRLTAAPYLAAEFAAPEVGLENHLNYIHRPGGTLSEDEAWGLAALFNSRLLDTYFRTANGNTQVSATELRAMPLPERNVIVGLGQRVKCLPDPTTGLDTLTMEVAGGFEPAETAVG
ncbi:MAG: Eco57I restriction-modification methylase domain-containing protein [Gammaproteobacteria bacterium]|nr:Eco57I restriction-modification methylase domain-containing protein [Gammaproteobacteria bacterium]